MKKHVVKVFAVLAAVMFLSITVLELNAHARAGGSRSSGSRGSRSYSRPASPAYNPGPARQQQAAPSPAPFQQPQGGSFLRSMAGGIAGGLLGGMLFRSLGMAGGGMGGGGGIGFFEIVLLAGIGYLIYRFIKKKREQSAGNAFSQGGYDAGSQGYRTIPASAPPQFEQPAADQVESGMYHIRQMDPSFDEERFKDSVMDSFFRIQAGWMNRDLAPVSGLLTDEMRRTFQDDIDRMLRDRQTNRLENIAVRNVDLVEVWQEGGQDFITTQVTANLLDYTTDDASGAVVAGSKVDPVKFDEYWTFSRPVGNNPWKLSAINQK